MPRECNANRMDNERYISIEFSESELRERDKRLSILLEMSNFLSSSMNLHELLKGALDRVLKHFELDAGRIYLPEESSTDLHLFSHRGLDPAGLERVSLHGSFTGKAFQTKSFIAQYVSELKDRERSKLLLSRGFKVVICVPLIVRDRVEGVMNLTPTRIITLDRGKVDLLTTIGNQMAVAVNNTRLYEELQRKIEALEEKKEMIKFFAYSISHDLKSPATALYALTKRLKEKHRDFLDEKGKTCCDQILKTAMQMAVLVDKINVYIIAKEAPLELEKISVKEVMESVRTEFTPILEERGIRWTEPENLPEIVGDKLALTRVFRNLVDNALKYGGEEMLEIRIGYNQEEDHHILSLSDDGVGIQDQDKEKVFGIFQRKDTSKGIAGCGLGLAIVKEIVERHGGRIWIAPGEKAGVTFCISVPREFRLDLS
jgi:K+-sensing histidine kinase KdpD